ncbi:hypothetical protein GCM10009858_09530 [Terrabacter carboxydivorans]|uniref:Uncharacterized protein n=1 Tax=Terrabacter carboxydivorans TaxID=619730 RepID=A0ABN3L0S1_9MICO
MVPPSSTQRSTGADQRTDRGRDPTFDEGDPAVAENDLAVDEGRDDGDHDEEQQGRDRDPVAEPEVHFVTSGAVGTCEASWMRRRGRRCV